ncbi:MAG: HAD family phosphatase [Coriobacteriales bacterium]|nr:HAD family phosphatase [Coriobacteriales bacterium]
MGVWYEVDQRFCETYDMQLPENYVQEIAALGFRETAQYFYDHSNLDMTVEEIGEKFNEMAVYAYSHTVKCFDGAVKYLQNLKKRGVKTAIATSVSKHLLKASMQANGFEELIDAVAFCDECGSNKHSSDVYALAARKIGCAPEECLVFEDVAVAIESAKRIGMTAGAIHDRHSFRNSERVREVADFYLESFAPLVEALEAQWD